NFPENTLASFDSALTKGANGIEMDIQLHHEKLLIVHNTIFDEKEYPTLEQVLQSFKDKGRMEIEIKAFENDIIEPLRKCLAENKVNNLELTTSTLPLIPYIRAVFPNVSIGAIFQPGDFPAWMNEDILFRKIYGMMHLLDANIAHIGSLPRERITLSLVSKLHTSHMKVHTHIYKEEMENQMASYTYFSEIGVDQCTFDDINLLSMVR
ncbi:MAG: glycerophosphodiester phosphodiesterase, partial [Candidatus Woesebacteria bacterium]